MDKKKLKSLLNLSCRNMSNLETILSQQGIIIYNKRLKEKELKTSKGMVMIQALNQATEEEIKISCKNEYGILKKFEIE